MYIIINIKYIIKLLNYYLNEYNFNFIKGFDLIARVYLSIKKK